MNMTSLASSFNCSLVDGDKQEVKENRQKYCEAVASLRANCILQSVVTLEMFNFLDFGFGRLYGSIFTGVFI